VFSYFLILWGYQLARKDRKMDIIKEIEINGFSVRLISAEDSGTRVEWYEPATGQWEWLRNCGGELSEVIAQVEEELAGWDINDENGYDWGDPKNEGYVESLLDSYDMV
jgi:hypothetical protein